LDSLLDRLAVGMVPASELFRHNIVGIGPSHHRSVRRLYRLLVHIDCRCIELEGLGDSNTFLAVELDMVPMKGLRA
jgi:hypothetical protein